MIYFGKHVRIDMDSYQNVFFFQSLFHTYDILVTNFIDGDTYAFILQYISL